MLTIVQRGGAAREKTPDVVRGQASRLPWAWDGLCFGVAFNDSTQDSARDLVWGAPPSAVSGLTWTRDNRGNPAAKLDEFSYIKYPDNPAHNKPSTAVTAYVRVRRDGTTFGDVSGGILAKRYSSSDSPWMSWGIVTDGTTTKMAGHTSVPSGYQYFETTYTLPIGEWVNGVLRWRSGTAPRIDVYGDRGDLRASATHVSAVSGTLQYAVGEPLVFNANEADHVNFLGSYSQGLVWSRYLSDTELQALISDPYGWYSPRRETVSVSGPYPLLFGGGELRHGTQLGGLR